jgi:hypothetical protein
MIIASANNMQLSSFCSLYNNDRWAAATLPFAPLDIAERKKVALSPPILILRLPKEASLTDAHQRSLWYHRPHHGSLGTDPSFLSVLISPHR